MKFFNRFKMLQEIINDAWLAFRENHAFLWAQKKTFAAFDNNLNDEISMVFFEIFSYYILDYRGSLSYADFGT